jgi:hypothetical protein
MMIDDQTMARWTEQVMIALRSLVDGGGLKVHLSADDEIMVLAAAITAVNNCRSDTVLFAPISISLKDLVT